ncbi:MAG: DUF2069 domain-containing protein [Oceanobacter sp.]
MTDESVVPAPSAFANKAKKAWQALVASYLGLMLVLLLQTFSNKPDGLDDLMMILLAGLGMWLFKVLPLLLFIPGLIKRSHKAASWLAYVIMLYFVLSVLLVFSPGSSVWGWLMVLTSLSIFLSSLLYTRWQKRVEAGL